MKKALMLLVAVVLAGAGAWLLSAQNKDRTDTSEKKTPHFESSTPSAGSTLASPPPNVTINFNFDLSDKSSITVIKDGRDYATNHTSIDENKLAMRRSVSQDAPDGRYQVKYTACWPDNSCHDGHFTFRIDRTQLGGYTDMRGQKEVTIHMSHLMFEPRQLRISKDTKVTWVNDDDAAHYVNTDSHPAHTHIPDFNSKALQKGQSYTYTFTKPGAYPYHCSAHAATMTATIVVD